MAPCVRRTNEDKLYPWDMSSAPSTDVHEDGEILSHFLFDFSWEVGGDFQVVDPILLLAVLLAPDAPSFRDMVDAMLDADQLLNGGANAGAIETAAAVRGITVYRPPEVSGAGSGLPLRVDRIPSGVRLLWEDLGILADGYNLYEWDLLPQPFPDGPHEAGNPLCAASSAAGPSGYRMLDVTPDFASSWFLVTAYANDMEGPAGYEWDPWWCCAERLPRDPSLNPDGLPDLGACPP